MEIITMKNMFPQSDGSIDYVSDEGDRVNIYKNREGYELSNSIGEIFISDFSSNEEMMSLIEYMIIAKKKIDVVESLIKYY